MNYRTIKRYIPVMLILILLIVAYTSGIMSYTSLSAFHEHRAALDAWVTSHPFIAPFVFTLLYIASAALGLPIVAMLTLLGGYLFGTILGSLYVISSATLGAFIIYSIARTSFGEGLRKSANKTYKRVEDDFQKNAILYLFFLRIVPAIPFAVANVLPALFLVKPWTFLWTTFLGIMPVTIIYVNVGTSLGTINELGDILSPRMIIALVLLGLAIISPVVIQKIRKQQNA